MDRPVCGALAESPTPAGGWHARASRSRYTAGPSDLTVTRPISFLHDVFDMWMRKQFPQLQFERYGDAGVVHCVNEKQAQLVRSGISERLAQCDRNLGTLAPCRSTRRDTRPTIWMHRTSSAWCRCRTIWKRVCCSRRSATPVCALTNDTSPTKC